EGQLAKLRASVVNMRALADVARGLGPYGLGPYLLLGKGEETTGGRDKASILADTLEALLGAIYLEHGLDVAGRVIRKLFDPLMGPGGSCRIYRDRCGCRTRDRGTDAGAVRLPRPRGTAAGLRRQPGRAAAVHRLAGAAGRSLDQGPAARLGRRLVHAGRHAG